MRILKVVQAYYPFQEKGGPVVKVRALAGGLVQRGHHVTVLTADLGLGKHGGLGLKFESCHWGWRSRDDGVEAIYLSTLSHYRALTINPRVVGFCRVALRRVDLVHFYGVYDLLGPVVGYFCRRQSVPYVIEPMGMFRPIVRSIRWKRLYHRLLGNHLVAGARFMIATSEQEQRELIACGISASRIAIRRNGIHSPECIPVPGEFRQKWGIQRDADLILFLGRLVSKKSPDLLIEAFARWRLKSSRGMNSVLVLAGPDEGDGFVPGLKRLADRLGLGESIRFVGPLYDECKWQAYSDADVFVLPSQNENFGNTAAESAACGTPVIVTDRCGVAPYVGQAGRVVAHDRAELEQALGELLGDSSVRQRFREGCAEMAQSLSWVGPIMQSERLYQQCLGETLER